MAAAATAQAAAPAGAGGKKKRSLWKRLTKKSKGGSTKPQDEPSEGSGSSSSRGAKKTARQPASQPLFEAFQETSPAAAPNSPLQGDVAAPASPVAARYVFSDDDAPGSSPHSPSQSGGLSHPHSPTRSKSSTSVGTHHSIHTTGHTTIHTATTTTGQLHGVLKPAPRSRTANGVPSPSKHHGGKSVAGTVGGVTLVTSTTASMTAPSHAPSGASAQQTTAAGSPQSAKASPGEAGGRYFGMNFLPASEEVRGVGATQSPKSTHGELAQATEPQTPSDEASAPPQQQQEEEPQWTAEWNRIETSESAGAAFDDSKARDPPQRHNPITPGAEQLLDVTRDRAASEVSEDIEVDAPPSLPVLAPPARTASEAKRGGLGVKVSVVTGTEASRPETNSNNSSVAQPKGKPARFGKGSMAKRPGKKKSMAPRERGSSQDNTTRTSAPQEPKEARSGDKADVVGARPKAQGAAAPARGIQKTQAPSAVSNKQRRSHSANRKKKDGTDATKKADASQPHLYAEIHVPVKAPPATGPALRDRTPSTQSADPSLAMTSVSSLTGRESLFASAPAGGGFDDAANALAGAWCCEQPHDQIPAVGPEKVDGEGYKTEDYFDYGGEYVIKKGGNGVEAVDGDEGVLASVINVFGQVFCSACRCFDFGGGGVEEVDGANATGATTGMGNKSVMSGGIDVGATIIGTVHDTTATIANFSRALSQGGSKKTVPTFSEPVAKI